MVLIFIFIYFEWLDTENQQNTSCLNKECDDAEEFITGHLHDSVILLHVLRPESFGFFFHV